MVTNFNQRRIAGGAGKGFAMCHWRLQSSWTFWNLPSKFSTFFCQFSHEVKEMLPSPSKDRNYWISMWSRLWSWRKRLDQALLIINNIDRYISSFWKGGIWDNRATTGSAILQSVAGMHLGMQDRKCTLSPGDTSVPRMGAAALGKSVLVL